MSSITRKPNGSYVIRIPTGKNLKGKYTSVSKVFWPSKPNLSYASLQKELSMFEKTLEMQVLNGDVTSPNSVPKDHKRTLFEDFCKIFLDIKKTEISPATWAFYKKIIDQHLIPAYGKMHMDEFGIRHVQEYIQFITNKEREDFHGLGQPIAATTVKRYVTVFRSVLSLAYTDNSFLHIRSIDSAIAELKEKKREISISEDRLRKLISDKEIPAIKIGNRNYIAMEIFDFIYNNRFSISSYHRKKERIVEHYSYIDQQIENIIKNRSLEVKMCRK